MEGSRAVVPRAGHVGFGACGQQLRAYVGMAVLGCDEQERLDGVARTQKKDLERLSSEQSTLSAANEKLGQTCKQREADLKKEKEAHASLKKQNDQTKKEVGDLKSTLGTIFIIEPY